MNVFILQTDSDVYYFVLDLSLFFGAVNICFYFQLYGWFLVKKKLDLVST